MTAGASLRADGDEGNEDGVATTLTVDAGDAEGTVTTAGSTGGGVFDEHASRNTPSPNPSRRVFMSRLYSRFMIAPTIETERFVLSAHTAEDLDALHGMWSDEAVVRFIGGHRSTRQESWARLLRYAGHWALLGFGFWAVRDRDSGRFMGEVGIARFERDGLDVAFGEHPEAGWALAPWAQGKGIATEALRAAIAWRFENTTLTCLIDSPNVGSIRVAKKCGFRRYATASLNGSEVQLFKRAPGLVESSA